MTFYSRCFGGKLSFRTLGEDRESRNMSAAMRSMIVHSSLSSGEIEIMASDLTEDIGLIRGNQVTLVIDCESRRECNRLYDKLREGCKRCQGPELNREGLYQAFVTDRFGNHWMLIAST